TRYRFIERPPLERHFPLTPRSRCPAAPLSRRLPPDLIRQLHKESVRRALQAGPVERLVALERAAVAQESHRPWCGLVRGQQVEPKAVELRGWLGHTADEQRIACGRIDQGGPPLRSVLADGTKEECPVRLVLDLEPGDGRAGELTPVQPIEPQDRGQSGHPDGGGGR